jgi:ectoine hydroxylase-related dioxygenase (phytanoyl-CoA dioxygenase family)
LSECYKLHTADDLQAGDVSFHTGTTFHYSGANTSPHARPALALAFIESGTCLCPVPLSLYTLHLILQTEDSLFTKTSSGRQRSKPCPCNRGCARTICAFATAALVCMC